MDTVAVKPSFVEMDKAVSEPLFRRPSELLGILKKPVMRGILDVFSAHSVGQREGSPKAESEHGLVYREFWHIVRLPRAWDLRDPTEDETAFLVETFAALAATWMRIMARHQGLSERGLSSYSDERPATVIIWRIPPEVAIQRAIYAAPPDYDGPTVKNFVTDGRGIVGPLEFKSYWRGHLL